MSEMDEAIYNSKPAIPNKLLNEDGTTTTINGDTATDAVTEYKSKPALPNKFLNPDGSYSTLGEIISGMVDTSIFIIVDELPATGDPEKIYLVPDGEGGFIEYHYKDGSWDTIGALSGDVPSQVYYWDGSTTGAGIEFWNAVKAVNETVPAIILYTNGSTPCWAYLAPNSIVNNYKLFFYALTWELAPNNYSYKVWQYRRQSLTFTVSNNTITALDKNSVTSEFHILDTAAQPSTTFMPTQDWQPATKKYVDDAISTNITQAIGGSY